QLRPVDVVCLRRTRSPLQQGARVPRASELVDLRWDQIDFQSADLAVRRVKRGNRTQVRSAAHFSKHVASAHKLLSLAKFNRKPARPLFSLRVLTVSEVCPHRTRR